MTIKELTHVHVFQPGDAGKAPLLLLHGTGGDERDLLPLGRVLSPGSPLLSPRGKVLEHGMTRFFRRLAMGVFDQEDLRQRTQELADFVRDAKDVYGFDGARLTATGYSNGANIAAAMLLLRPEALHAAALFRPMVPFEPEAVPDLSGKRIFIGAARRDEYSSEEQTRRLAELLESGGAEVEVHWVGGGHALTQADVDAAREWFATSSSAR
ncbi:MAG: alpha/beta hydrolase [Bryobacteraceae bacterium]|nr:alpha/beta hydrolase [Bryobacteraceae bacterium]